MKTMIILLLALCLFHGTASAEVNRSLSEKFILLNSQTEYNINGTNTKVFITMDKHGFLDNSSGNIKLQAMQNLFFFSLWNPSNSPAAAITFSSKNTPYFIIYNNGNEEMQRFKIDTIGANYLSFNVNNTTLQPLIQADKVAVVLTLKDGTTDEISISDEVLKDWKEIINSDLLQEHQTRI